MDTFTWKGYEWEKRTSAGAPAHNGQWNPDGVIVAPDGSVALNLSNPTGDSPYSAEFLSVQEGWGYGTYTVTVDAALSTMHHNVVFGGLFLYDSSDSAPITHREIDVHETSAWGGEFAPTVAHTYWRDVAGVNTSEAEYVPVPAETLQTHVLIWQQDRLTYRSYLGGAATGTPYHETVFFDDVPTPGNEKVHFNLWSFALDGDTATADTTSNTTVIIKDFSYSTTVLPPPPLPAAPYDLGLYETQQAGGMYVNEAQWVHACAGYNRLLVVATACLGDGVAPSEYVITYAGRTFTKFTESISGTVRTQVWYLLDPPQGFNNITVSTVTPNINSHAAFYSASFYGVDLTMPFDTAHNDTLHPLTLSLFTTKPDSYIYGVAAKYSTADLLVPASGQTNESQVSGTGWGLSTAIAHKSAPTATGYTLEWTYTDGMDGAATGFALVRAPVPTAVNQGAAFMYFL